MVVFTGAGMSTESGIPDYRSPGGVWERHNPPQFQEFMTSSKARTAYWRFYQEAFWDFFKAQPHQGHLALGRFYEAGNLKAVVTQNIDGLHVRGGVAPEAMWELHGTVAKTSCLSCKKHMEDTEAVLKRFEVGELDPACPLCGGILKPATISFGQSLDQNVLQGAAQACAEADLLIVAGSSLVVHPAAALPRLTLENHGRVVLMNRDETWLDDHATLVIREPIGQVLGETADLLLGDCN
ncbi:NAD-dependent deacetylase [Dethiosulfatarculus sandiegensis]|uniref:protein acetyllysine N-acetyltransferase n=1 Tax=Dethiosulfatarculus sandiegensis TaxID=1429043 RepID=A0A0D2JC85_9BACT|nr:NAD-dependent deacetylase [Dethiosulfatarculus sandiegensis]